MTSGIRDAVRGAVKQLAREHQRRERKAGQRSCVYLDHNGGAPLDMELYEELSPLMDACNPSSIHNSCGQESKKAVQKCREVVRQLCRCPPERGDSVIFTSGSTESMNSLLRSTRMTWGHPAQEVQVRLK